jgi:hypothetical protein
MKEYIKDYGSLIGPITAFLLGVLALYVKYSIDRKLDEWKSRKRLKKLFELIKHSAPPSHYHPNKPKDGLIHANEARNITNLSNFNHRLTVLSMFIEKIANDVMVHSTLGEVQQFHRIKWLVEGIKSRVEKMRGDTEDESSIKSTRLFSNVEAPDFYFLWNLYNSMLDACENPASQFEYISSGTDVMIPRNIHLAAKKDLQRTATFRAKET